MLLRVAMELAFSIFSNGGLLRLAPTHGLGAYRQGIFWVLFQQGPAKDQ